MDILEKFIRKVAYKFPKGYPDINNPEDKALLFELLEFDNLLQEGSLVSNTKKAIQKLIKDHSGFFDTQNDNYRISNLKKIKSEEFVEKIKQSFPEVKNIQVIGPGEGKNTKNSTPKGSSKYNMYQFDTEDGEVIMILSGGMAANKGQQFEDRIYIGLRDAVGYPMEDVTDPIIKQILQELNINPETLQDGAVEQTGGKDTKRPLDLEKGPEDSGKVIADVAIEADKPYYLSIKDKTGDNIYNGGNVSSITFNSEKDRIILDKNTFDADRTKVKLFDIFKVDPEKIVTGLNNYINKSGPEEIFQEVNFDKTEVSKMIGSAVDYGYYYVRQADGDSVKIIPILTPEATYKLIGTPTSVKVRYPSVKTKTTGIIIELENSSAGFTKVLIEIRNAQGGIDRPSIKAKIL